MFDIESARSAEGLDQIFANDTDKIEDHVFRFIESMDENSHCPNSSSGLSTRLLLNSISKPVKSHMLVCAYDEDE